MRWLWLGALAAGGLLLAGGTGRVGTEAAAQAAQAGERQEQEREETTPRRDSVDSPHGIPIEPILVQGYVKNIQKEQLTLTAPGAPVDLPMTLREETRFIQGEEDVERSAVQEGQLVRAALLPVGDDLVALVVEVVPEQEAAPRQPGNEDLQGEPPPATPTPAEPAVPEPPAPEPERGTPDRPVQEGKTTHL